MKIKLENGKHNLTFCFETPLVETSPSMDEREMMKESIHNFHLAFESYSP